MINKLKRCDDKHIGKANFINKMPLYLILIILFAFMSFSCAGERVVTNDSIEYANNITTSGIEIYPGDEIEIKFAYVPEFNETIMVRTDGKIDLLLIGELFVEGKTPTEVKNELIELYSKHLSHPELVVIMRNSFRNRVYVGGAVNSPGVVNLVGPMSILDAITETGGFDLDTAKINDVLLLRLKNDKHYVYTINVKSYLSGKNPNIVFLQPQDVVYVPRTRIVNMASYVEKIWAIIPFRFSATYVIRRGDIDDIFD